MSKYIHYLFWDILTFNLLSSDYHDKEWQIHYLFIYLLWSEKTLPGVTGVIYIFILFNLLVLVMKSKAFICMNYVYIIYTQCIYFFVFPMQKLQKFRGKFI